MERFGCTIEMEPRTLNEGAMNNAREAAVDIIQQKEPGEASTIFTEGMREIVPMKVMEEAAKRRDQLHKLVEIDDHAAEVTNRSWNLPCTTAPFEEFPDKTKITEPFSAPF